MTVDEAWRRAAELEAAWGSEGTSDAQRAARFAFDSFARSAHTLYALGLIDRLPKLVDPNA